LSGREKQIRIRLSDAMDGSPTNAFCKEAEDALRLLKSWERVSGQDAFARRSDGKTFYDMIEQGQPFVNDDF